MKVEASGKWRNVIGDTEFKEMRGQDVKVIRNGPHLGWRKSEPECSVNSRGEESIDLEDAERVMQNGLS